VAVVACDQYTSEVEYWHSVAREVDDAPSTLNLIFPEVFLGSADAPARIRKIQETMRHYLAAGLLRDTQVRSTSSAQWVTARAVA